MPKNKKIHANTARLQSLIAEHGIDAVLAATGYKMSTLGIYAGDKGSVIPTTRLDIAAKLLAK